MWYAALSVVVLLSVLLFGGSCQGNKSPATPVAVAPSNAPGAAKRPDASGRSKPPERPRITNAIVGLPTPPPARVHPVLTDAEAVALADALLAFLNADWGRPSSVQKMESGNYRIEYGKDTRGVARAVLVNAETSRASFPLPP